MMVFIRKAIKWLPFFLLYIPFKISTLFSKNKRNVLLFGTGTGFYHDNSKYLFEYFLENKADYPTLKAFWVATEKSTYIELHNMGIPVLYRNSIECAINAAHSKAYFSTSGLLDIFWFIDKNTLLIQLWHGTPIKKIGFDTLVDSTRLAKAEKYFTQNYQFKRYDYLIIEDNKYKKIFESAFQISEEKILGLGQARNIIFNKSNFEKINQIKKQLHLESFNKVILYAPTFRDNKISNLELLKSLLTIEAEEYLSANNYCLIVKLHPFLSFDTEIKNFLNQLCNSIINIDIIDIQKLLIISDAVITDISSLALDYLQYSTNLYQYFPDEKNYIDVRGNFYELTFRELLENAKKIESLEYIEFNNHEFYNYNKTMVCKDILQLVNNSRTKV